MPIKVRCKECAQVMAVPDKAAGKAVKCKGCGGRVGVPTPKGSSSSRPAAKGKPAAAGEAPPRKKKKKKRPRPAPAAEPSFDDFGGDDMFSGIDLGRAEDGDIKVCPNCTQQVDEEDIECPNCGVNVDTGVLSTQQRQRRARKGPPPEEYYGVVWKNSWEFLMGHKGFAFKSGLLWGFSATMVIISAFTLNWYTRTRAIELRESADGPVTISAAGVLIEPGDDGVASYDGVTYGKESTRLVNGKAMLPTPEMAAMFAPPAFFWAFIFLVFSLSFGGWAWVLSAKITELTISKQKKIKRFQGDMFANMTKGFTTIFWPLILMYPVIWIPGAMFAAGVSEMVCLITFLAIFMLPYFLFLPLATVHMAQPYSYRAWLLNWTAKDFFSTLVPSIFTSGLFVLLVLLVPLGIAIGVAVGWDQFASFYMTKVELPALSSTVGYTMEFADSTGTFTFFRMPFLFMVSFLSCTLLFTILAFPAIMMMRIFGLFALYFREDMDICVEQQPMAPAGFGPRFLAIHVDGVICSLMCVVMLQVGGFASGLFGALYDSESVKVIVYWVASIGGSLIVLAFYFANWESGAGRATLGKWSLGMVVLKEDSSPMKFDHAIKRFIASLLTFLSLGITFIMCLFHPTHRAVHDTLTKTKVVWRGDDDR